MAKKEVVLPVSKAKVILKDPKELKVKDRKKVYSNAANAEQGIMQALSLTDGLIAIMVDSWELELPIPSVKISVLDEMEMADYDFLTEQTKDAQKILFPALAETEETTKDVDSPFGNSNV
jgi:hypothetical protein